MHRSVVAAGFTQLLMARELREHIFPLTYRIERCAPEDIAVVDHYLAFVSQGLAAQNPADRASPALQIHVALARLWEDPAPSLDELTERCADRVLCPGVGPVIGARSYYWPSYMQDEYANAWPTTQTTAEMCGSCTVRNRGRPLLLIGG